MSSSRDQRDTFTIGAAGGDEVVVPWPLFRRLYRRAREVVPGPKETPVGGRHHRWVVLWTVLAGLFSVNVTFTIFAVALTNVAHGLHTSLADVTWVITAPLLTFGVAAPVLGKIGDTYGHRRLYLAGTALAVVCALLTAAAPNIGSLIAARALSGIDGAAAGAASMALIFRVFEEEDRTKAMGWWSLVGAGGPVIGVVVGGFLISAFGWRALFLLQAPLTTAALVVAYLVLPETEPARSEAFDRAGAVAITVSVTALLVGLNRGPVMGWSSPLVVGAFVLCPVAAVLFVRAERRARAPLLPLELLRRRNFSFPIANQVFTNFAYMGGFILAPILLERVYGLSTAGAGLMVIARPLTFSIVAPVAGYLAGRVGQRFSAVAGSAALAASMAVFAVVTRESGTTWVILALALSGVGMGVASPSVAAAVANSVDEDSLGVASASQQLMAQVGVVAGIQVMQTIQASRQAAAGLVGSFHDAYLVGIVMCVAAAACGFGMLSRRMTAASELAIS
ncbi:MAG TPA: MFS transporter [Acidimicrobiales bacterium]|nr:MFS transporter [Acidimicrobiales bacterium]